jgi:cytochrome c5
MAQEPDDGAAIYQAKCAACHQPDGTGIPGTFPPLADNPHIADTDYVASVIENGLSGEIEVNGVTYDGQMPVLGLSDAEASAVISFLQAGFTETASSPGATPAEDPFPWGTLFLFATAIVVVGGAVFLAYPAPVALTRGRALGAGLVIFLYFTLATVWLPSHLLDDPALADWPDLIREGLVTAVWAGALGVGIVGLRLAQRSGRI